MSKYIFLLGMMLLSMCAPEKSRFDILEEKQAEQIKTGIRTDTIFMDLTYGMSQRQTFESFQKKVNDSIFTLRKNGAFEYNMPLDAGMVRVAFHANFSKDSLYSLSLILKGKNVAEAELLQQKMVKLLEKKNGSPVTFPCESDKTKNDYYFIAGNQQIEIKYPYKSNRTIVTCSDYAMENRISKDQQKKNAKIPDSQEE
jgi:hypothetical protein